MLENKTQVANFNSLQFQWNFTHLAEKHELDAEKQLNLCIAKYMILLVYSLKAELFFPKCKFPQKLNFFLHYVRYPKTNALM